MKKVFRETTGKKFYRKLFHFWLFCCFLSCLFVREWKKLQRLSLLFIFQRENFPYQSSFSCCIRKWIKTIAFNAQIMKFHDDERTSGSVCFSSSSQFMRFHKFQFHLLKKLWREKRFNYENLNFEISLTFAIRKAHFEPWNYSFEIHLRFKGVRKILGWFTRCVINLKKLE